MTNFKQNLTVLFWLYRQKAKADGKAPIYARITIDGKYTEIVCLQTNLDNSLESIFRFIKLLIFGLDTGFSAV